MSPKHTHPLLHAERPLCPAPKTVPSHSPAGAVCAAMVKNCLYHYIYVWTTFGVHFWMFPTRSEEGRALFGYQWDGKVWRYIKIDHVLIESFY